MISQEGAPLLIEPQTSRAAALALAILPSGPIRQVRGCLEARRLRGAEAVRRSPVPGSP